MQVIIAKRKSESKEEQGVCSLSCGGCLETSFSKMSLLLSQELLGPGMMHSCSVPVYAEEPDTCNNTRRLGTKGKKAERRTSSLTANLLG
jgi:hypothetical protein